MIIALKANAMSLSGEMPCSSAIDAASKAYSTGSLNMQILPSSILVYCLNVFKWTSHSSTDFDLQFAVHHALSLS
jgi:hypothetical protein